MSEIAVLPFGDGDVVFMAALDGGVIVYGRTPVGGTPMPAELFNQGPAELYRQLAPGTAVPEALLRAERVERETAAAAREVGVPAVQPELLPAEALESGAPDPEYRVPAGEAFGAFEAWFEDNYCGYSEPELETCTLGRTSGRELTYKNINKAGQYLYVESGQVTWELRRGTTLYGSALYNAGYVYGPWTYHAGYVDYGVYIYWKIATIKWTYLPTAGALFHYAGWATADGGLFIQ
jgi:hypothetical protein